jgi:signal peptidase I
VVGFVALLAASSVLWLSVWAVAVPLFRGWSPIVVMSGSMGPAIDTGDIVIAAPYQGQELPLGSVIVFDNPSGPGPLIHRVVQVTPDRHYITKGDANATNDSTSVAPDQVRGVGRILVPRAGLPFVWVSGGQWGHLAVAIVAVSVVFWMARWVGGTKRISPLVIS